MRIEVCEARVDGALRIEVTVPAGSTVQDAIDASGIVDRLGLERATLSVGVFGRRVPASTPLRDGDRVEIYRPLIVDPKEARRRRAEARGRSK